VLQDAEHALLLVHDDDLRVLSGGKEGNNDGVFRQIANRSCEVVVLVIRERVQPNLTILALGEHVHDAVVFSLVGRTDDGSLQLGFRLGLRGLPLSRLLAFFEKLDRAVLEENGDLEVAFKVLFLENPEHLLGPLELVSDACRS